MSKLHKKMVALGDMTQHTYADVVAACGPPKETKACSFTDIGEGTRSTWSDGVFTITFNFDQTGHYCGIYHHRNWEPYIWLGAITAFIVAAALIIGGQMRKNASGGDAVTLTKRIMDSQAVWKTDDTAGASLIDLDFDGSPELVAVDTEIKYYPELEADYFGPSTVRAYSLESGTPEQLLEFNTSDYCFAAVIHRYTDAAGNTGWYYSTDGEVWTLSVTDGLVALEQAAEMPDVSGGDEPVDLMQNESWINVADNTAAAENVETDIAAMAELWYAPAE